MSEEPRRWASEPGELPPGLGAALAAAHEDLGTDAEVRALEASVLRAIAGGGGGGGGGGGAAAKAGATGAAAAGATTSGALVAGLLGSLALGAAWWSYDLGRESLEREAPDEATRAEIEAHAWEETEALIAAHRDAPAEATAVPEELDPAEPPEGSADEPDEPTEEPAEEPEVPPTSLGSRDEPGGIEPEGADEDPVTETEATEAVEPVAVEPVNERALVREATALLRTDPAAALALTERLARVPEPAWAEERERVAVEALVRLGRRAAAEERFERFTAAYPASAYGARLRELFTEP